MQDRIYSFVMVPMVYAALGVFLAGVIVRGMKVLLAPRQHTTLQIFPAPRHPRLRALADTFLLPTVRTDRPALWFCLMLFHGALVLLVIGHIELIRGIRALQIFPHQGFLGGGLVGLVLTIALCFFLVSRFRTPYREISVPEDYFLLLLLLVTVLTGSHMSWASYISPAGFDIAVQSHREYLSSLLVLRPSVPAGIAGSPHYVLVALHIFFANCFLMFLPFSKIVHTFFALPLNLIRRGGLYGARSTPGTADAL
ncbi:MAG TPA: respiratory nitrate reductase subunit gamma [Nitrospirota bacterium]|nr:respiratory nitrate reductase subunit gamma [Nitrospirota bacterium]